MDTTQMLKGVLPMTVLSVLDSDETYGYDVLHRLRAAGLDSVGDASVYGTLQRMYDSGLLSSYVVESSSGPSRRYYSLTTSGSAALKDARERWGPFAAAVTRLLDPEGVSV